MNYLRTKFLEEQKKDLDENISNIAAQMRILDPASIEYKNLKTRSNIYFSELEKVETELSSANESSLNKNQRGNLFDKKLQKIDFRKPKEKIEQIFERYGRQGVSAFFLIENINKTKGDLLVDEIRDSLTQRYSYEPIKRCYVDLLSNPIVDEQSLLSAIADGFSKSSSENQASDLQQYAQNIIDEIGGSLQPGSIVFFELNYWDALEDNQDYLLSWLIEYFWIPLTDKHSQISKNFSNIRIIIFITTLSSLSEKCLTLPYFCNQSQFSQQKILKLSLQTKWNEEEISQWIEDVYKYSRQESLAVSRLILFLSRGDPVDTCSALQKKFNKMS